MTIATYDRLHAAFLATLEDPSVRVQVQSPNWQTIRCELAQKLAHLTQGDATTVVWLLVQQVSIAAAAECTDLLVQVLDVVDSAGEFVAQVAADKALPETVQREAVRHLGRRREPRCTQTLLAVLGDRYRATAVRRAALDALVEAHVTEALPLLQGRSAQQLQVLGADELLVARLRLGDASALRSLLEVKPQALSELLFVPATERCRLLDELGGLPAILDHLAAPSAATDEARLHLLAAQDCTPGVRRWALDALTFFAPDAAAPALLAALGDSDSGVAAAASRCLRRLNPPPLAALATMAVDQSIGTMARVWAIYTLSLQGEAVEELVLTLPEATPVLPVPLSPALRAALSVVSLAARDEEIDPRWRLAACLAGHRQPYRGDEDVARLVASLRAASLNARANDQFPRPATGTGYWKLALRNEDYLYVSRKGPFATFAVENIVTYEAGNWIARHQVDDLAEIDPFGERALKRRRAQEAAAAAGYQWLDNTLLSLTAPGLTAEPVTLWSLLFEAAAS